MEEIIISDDDHGGLATLVKLPGGQLGLQLKNAPGIADGIYMPDDVLGIFKGNTLRAADVVNDWAKAWFLTPESMQAARSYLAQWPEGPQV